MHSPCVLKRAEDLWGAWELLYPAGTFPWRKHLPQLLVVSKSPSSPKQENNPCSLQGGKTELAPGAAPAGLPDGCLQGARPAGGRAESAKGGPQGPRRGAGHISGWTKIREASCWTWLTFRSWRIICKNKFKRNFIYLITFTYNSNEKPLLKAKCLIHTYKTKLLNNP